MSLPNDLSSYDQLEFSEGRLSYARAKLIKTLRHIGRAPLNNILNNILSSTANYADQFLFDSAARFSLELYKDSDNLVSYMGQLVAEETETRRNLLTRRSFSERLLGAPSLFAYIGKLSLPNVQECIDICSGFSPEDIVLDNPVAQDLITSPSISTEYKAVLLKGLGAAQTIIGIENQEILETLGLNKVA